MRSLLSSLALSTLACSAASCEERAQEPSSAGSEALAPGREAPAGDDDDVPLPRDTLSGELQTYEGRFDIDRLPQGKRFQGAWLTQDGGESLLLAYRPMPEHFAFVDKRVIVEGRPYSPGGQQIGAEHVRVESLRLADGETAPAQPPTSLPVPPRVETGEELGARVGRWVEVFATLIGEREGTADGDWRTLEFRTGDGSTVITVEASWVVDGTFRAHFGRRVTLLGKVFDGGDGQLGLGPVSVCLGEVEGCGMTAKALRR